MLRVPLAHKSPRAANKLAAAIGLLALLAGALFLQIGRLCTELGQFWGGQRNRRTLAQAITYFCQRTPEGNAQQRRSGWEQTLLRVGPVVVLSIAGMLASLWLLMLVGGTLAWLASNGYGAWLLLGCVLFGTTLGCWLSHLNSKALPHNLN